MSEQEIDLLKRICSGEVTDYRTLSPMDVERLNAFQSRKLVEIHNAGFFDVKPAACDLLSELEQAANETAQQKADEARQHEEDRAYQAKQDRKNRHHNYLIALFEALLAYLIGVITQSEFDISGFFVELFDKAASFFH